MVLRDVHIAAKRVNWGDKVSNLESLAAELNIGLDSMIFIDDSPFESEAVRSRLPQVTTIQVPSDLSEYPGVIARIGRLVATDLVANDAASKTEQYRSRARAEEQRQRFATQDEYLASLGLKVTIRRNDKAASARIAELTQKSNQFNLTTHRYTVAEIESLMGSSESDVYSIRVADRFGDSGLTAVVITRGTGDTVQIDTFLVSCRVLGRGIELSFWETIRRDALEDGRRTLTAEYLPTSKNAQVADFWDRLGLERVGDDPSGLRRYEADLTVLALATPPAPIEVDNGS
jgi:FkbH-like protein